MPRKEAAADPEPAVRRAAPAKGATEEKPRRRSTGRGPARRPRKSGRAAAKDASPTQGSTEQGAALAAEVEARLRNAIDELEQRLARLARAAPDQGSAAEPADAFEDLSVAFRRACGEAVDRKLEQALGLAARLYQRLEADAQGLCDEPAPAAPEELRAVFASALEDLAGVVGALGGALIRPAVGDHYDPVIHLAVGEGTGAGSGQARVLEVVRPGCRSARGRVLLQAKVIVGRG